MRMTAHSRWRSSLCPLAVLAALGLAASALAGPAIETVDVEDLPTKVILLPNGSKAVFINYGEHSWRMAPPNVLQGKEIIEKEVCFSAKYDSPLPPDRVKLFGLQGYLVVDDRAKFKAVSELHRGDNIYVCGELRAARDGKGLELRIIHLLKERQDEEKYDKKISIASKKGDFDELIDIGHGIEELRTSNQVNFDKIERLAVLRDKAWREGLQLKEQSLKRDDADGLLALALQWRELLKGHSRFRALVEQSLRVDPDHPRASRVAEKELGLKKFEGKWMRPDQIQAELERRKVELERLADAEKTRLEDQARAREKAIAERPLLLLKSQAALRAKGAGARGGAIAALGEAIAKSPDSGFGEEAIDVLANLSDGGAAQALSAAAKTEFANLRKKIFEALVWRTRQQDNSAQDVLVKALVAEKDAAAARACVDAVISLDGKTAAQTLVRSLSAEDRTVREEISEGLKLVTRQSISSKEGWEDWWNRNKATFNPQ